MIEKARRKEDAETEKKRDKEDEVRYDRYDKEDKEREAKRDKEDKERRARYDREDAQRKEKGKASAAPPDLWALAFDPDQERDESGRWTSGGAGGKDKPAEPAKDPGDRPARPEGGFATEKDVKDHAAKMVEAHDADPHVAALASARDGWQKKADDPKADPNERAAAREHLAKAEANVSHESRRSFLMSFRVPHDERPKVDAKYDLSNYNKTERVEAFHDGAHYLSDISSRGAIGDQKVNTDHAKGGRPSYESGTVKLGKGDGPAIAVHELGHHLEEKPEVRERVQEFSRERFGDEKPKDMAEVAPRDGYKKGEEFGRKDDLEKSFGGDQSKAYYAGKTYGGGRGEVLSMGLEQLHRDPVGLAKSDPHYFGMLVGILQGAKK